MTRQRSPNCPQIPFTEALEKGRKVYDKEHTHAAAKTVVAADLGYSGINGRSLSLIGALRQYGILEGTGDAMRVSDDAVAAYESDGEVKRMAIARLIFNPSLFEEMRTQFGDTTPSEANLKHWLIKKSFLPKAASDIIRVYKANLELVGGEESGYSGGEDKHREAPMTAINPLVSATQKPTPGLQTYAFALSPHARAELSLRGEITPEDLELLRDHIELTIKALARKVKSETAEK